MFEIYLDLSVGYLSFTIIEQNNTVLEINY